MKRHLICFVLVCVIGCKPTYKFIPIANSQTQVIDSNHVVIDNAIFTMKNRLQSGATFVLKNPNYILLHVEVVNKGKEFLKVEPTHFTLTGTTNRGKSISLMAEDPVLLIEKWRKSSADLLDADFKASARKPRKNSIIYDYPQAMEDNSKRLQVFNTVNEALLKTVFIDPNKSTRGIVMFKTARKLRKVKMDFNSNGIIYSAEFKVQEVYKNSQ